MYTELKSIDLPTIYRLLVDNNLSIQKAEQEVEVARGKFASAVGAAFPVIAPTAIFSYYNGVHPSSTQGVVTADFRALTPAAAIQWVINPGRTIYTIVADEDRLAAAREQEQSVDNQSMAEAALQFYNLILAQADVASANATMRERKEQLRLANLQFQQGVNIAADVASSRAAYAGSQRDLLLALYHFYRRSAALATTLRINPAITLVPRAHHLRLRQLVRTNFTEKQLVIIALKNRPDLQVAQQYIRAAEAQQGAVGWGDLGPTMTAGYAVGADTRNAAYTKSPKGGWKNFHYRGFQEGQAGIGWKLGLSTFGDIHAAAALQKISIINANQVIDNIEQQVVIIQQASAVNAKLIPIVTSELSAARYALRTTQANFKNGTATEVDVLVREAQLAKARSDYDQAIVEYNESQIALVAALGLMDAKAMYASGQSQSHLRNSAAKRIACR
ncbi:MAG: TolC family protein [Phycisphaerae bacterium]